MCGCLSNSPGDINWGPLNFLSFVLCKLLRGVPGVFHNTDCGWVSRLLLLLLLLLLRLVLLLLLLFQPPEIEKEGAMERERDPYLQTDATRAPGCGLWMGSIQSSCIRKLCALATLANSQTQNSVPGPRDAWLAGRPPKYTELDANPNCIVSISPPPPTQAASCPFKSGDPHNESLLLCWGSAG